MSPIFSVITDISGNICSKEYSNSCKDILWLFNSLIKITPGGIRKEIS
jgi:hypothetical protein